MKYLVISYAESRDESACGCIVASYPSHLETRQCDTMEEVEEHIVALNGHEENIYDHEVFSAETFYQAGDELCIVDWGKIDDETKKRIEQKEADRKIRESRERVHAQEAQEIRERKKLAELQEKYG